MSMQAQAAPAPRISTEALAAQPFMRDPKISPDGKHVAAWFDIGGHAKLEVISVDGKETHLIATGEKHEINWYRWAGNGTVLISIGSSVKFFGTDTWQTRLVAFDLATGGGRYIGGKTEGLIGDDVLWIDPQGRSILLSYQRSVYDYPSVSRIDIATNTETHLIDQRIDVWGWYADQSGVVRAGVGIDGNRFRMIYRTKADDKFRTVLKGKLDDEEAGWDAYRIFQGTDEGYRVMADDETGRMALFRYNFATREKGAKVFENATNDVDDFDTDDSDNHLVAATYTDDSPRIHWFDKSMADTQAALDAAMPGHQVRIVSRSEDDSAMIVFVGSSGDPGSFYLFRPKLRQLTLFAPVNDKLDPAGLAASRYVHYTARDGLEIPAYLTLPPGREAKGLPLIVMPHGGPYDVRDDGSFDDTVQLLANRGYAVLQPEYRGSGGYGKPFYQKGEGQWGRAMQDDLDDGMDWLAKQGTIDRKRVCIVGSSYGGYAALWGAARNPERYRCAASFAGVSDLKRQLDFQITFKISKRYRKDWRRAVQGEPDFDLKTVSPLYAVDRLRVPVMLMHGDADQRVPYDQSELFADKLKDAGKTYEFYTLAGEGHGFSSSANEKQWLDRLDTFVAKYNPAG